MSQGPSTSDVRRLAPMSIRTTCEPGARHDVMTIFTQPLHPLSKCRGPCVWTDLGRNRVLIDVRVLCQTLSEGEMVGL